MKESLPLSNLKGFVVSVGRSDLQNGTEKVENPLLDVLPRVSMPAPWQVMMTFS